MAYKPEKIWSDADDYHLMQLHGTMPNRQVAKTMGRTIHSIDCRIRILRNLGIMPQPEAKPLWSEADDRYLIANYSKFTSALLAEDLNRSVEAVNSRLRRLKRGGMQIGDMPRGRGRSKLAEAARAEVKDMEVSLASEREAMRDEVKAYLRTQVMCRQLTIEQATTLAQTISQSVLQAPEWQFKRYANKPVAVIVQEAA